VGVGIAFLVTCYVAAPGAHFYSGDPVGQKHNLVTAACPWRYKIGTELFIESVGTVKCLDRGGLVDGNHIDIYMDTGNYFRDRQACIRWGKKLLAVSQN